MFEKLFPDARTAARHQSGPLAEDRIAFLSDRASQGYKTSTLRWLAAELLIVAQQLPVGRDQKVGVAKIEEVANRWHGRSGKTTDGIRDVFRSTAVAWFRYLNRLEEPPAPAVPFLAQVVDFATYMEKERGLEASTIERRCQYIKDFLVWAAFRRHGLSQFAIGD